ncbi:hypothetical protein [Shewanella algae]|uniref:hypothetical protein n=1 Tax=Shewanella algae TaxID=38313 RepID=UPI001AAE91BC|nr:hypothetical protein [Shewanella algae]MBO2583259.1 hypothetical protein [Shewanella algae]
MNEDIKLSAQRALLGCVTRGLRAVSIELSDQKILWRCVFGSEIAKDSQWEILSEAAAEVVADFPEPMKIEEEYLVVRFRDSDQSPPNEIPHLEHVVFLRYENEGYPELAIST